jgi:predicted transglutaminase-like cysteine proteinase
VTKTLFAWLVGGLFIATPAIGIAEFSPHLLEKIQSTWGNGSVVRLREWESEFHEWEIKNHRKLIEWGESDLKPINRFWNKVPYLADGVHWKMDDYWATPLEMLASNAGDCEDYSIAKYFSLKELGLPPGSLRITYVRALKTNESHMVLAYYPKPDADPYILDNMTGKLLLASERMDLEPIYSFNDDDMWAAGMAESKGKSSQIRLWSELLEKMEKERRM